MRSVISFLGVNYDWVIQWGPALTVAIALIGVLSIWWLYRTGVRRRWVALAGITSALASFSVGAPVVFLHRNFAALAVPVDYAHENVIIPTEGAALAGEILTPNAKRRGPAMIFLVGSDVSSYHTNYSPLVNEVLTPTFARLGYTMLYFDKRGIGRSTGDLWTADFHRLASDAYHGIQFLKRHPLVDSAKIVVVGHSQGGWIAQLVGATHRDVQAVISLVGPSVTVREQTFDDEFQNALCAGSDSAAADSGAKALLSELDRMSLAADGRDALWATMNTYDPTAALRAIQQPTLLLFAENDVLVPSRRNVDRLNQIFDGHTPEHITVRIIPSASHALRTSPRCHNGSQRRLPWSPDAVHAIKEWVEGLDGHQRGSRENTEGARAPLTPPPQ